MNSPRLRVSGSKTIVNGRSMSLLRALWNGFNHKLTNVVVWVLFGPHPLKTVNDLGLGTDSTGEGGQGSHDEAA
jgi:hypothetical protein